MSRFYRIKEVLINLGITDRTLRIKIERGLLPPLEHPNPINARVSGYSEATYVQITRTIFKVECEDCG
jgi:DNA-binding transcriptional MerR regulator